MAFKFKDQISKVKFYGSSEEQKFQNSKTDNIISKRILFLICLTAVFIVVLIARLAYIQFHQADDLAVKLETYGSQTYTSDAPRGEIYDRNYTKLVGNKNVICVTYYAPKSIKSEEITTIAKFLARNIQLDNDANSVTLRNKKDYFIMKHKKEADALVSNQERKKYQGQENEKKVIYNLQLERISEDMINNAMSQDDIEEARFEYLMNNCTSGAVVLAEGISVEEASIIGENSNFLKGIEVNTDWIRSNEQNNQLKTVLGRVTTKKEGLPAEMKKQLLALGYQNNARVGISGLESQYENILRGGDSTYTLTYDQNGNPKRVNTKEGSSGQNIRLSIDSELQQLSDSLIENELKAANSRNKYFNQMYFMMIDPNTGDILVMSGKEIDKETGEVSDFAYGNYTSSVKIGSTTKAGTLYTGFKENVIVPNTYFVDEPIVFKYTKAKKSWKTMGNINEVDAMALSSNVYMFKLVMKLANFNYVPNGPLNISMETFTKSMATLRRDLGELGLGVKTGVDVPNEGLGYRGSKTERGMLLDMAIGQYDTYTPIQLAQYTCTLANMGVKVRPHFLVDSFKKDNNGNNVVTYSYKKDIMDDVSNQTDAFQQIKKGMRACVTRSDGTTHKYWSEKPYAVYCKSGTAETYDPNDTTDYPNHLQIGYISATEDSQPLVAFVCVCYRQTVASSGDSSSTAYISNQIIDKYVEKYGLNEK